jgi:2-dehydro-3-deoxygluconokinase
MKGLLTLGETMAKLVGAAVGPLRHARTLAVGVAGAESNVAIGVHRLGHPATWVGRVGDDEPGRLVASTLRGEGIETVAIVDPGAQTGLMLAERRSADLRRVAYYRDGSAGSRLRPDDVPLAAVREAGILHVTGVTTALSPSASDAVHTAVHTAREAGVPVSLDLNYRAALWSHDAAAHALRPLAERADIVFAGLDEAVLLVDEECAEDAARALATLGPRTAVVTLGARGAVACVDGNVLSTPAVLVSAVDPIGAGDAFVSGYLAGLLDGLAAEACLNLAARSGAFAVTVEGDWEGLPSRAELALLDAAAGEILR